MAMLKKQREQRVFTDAERKQYGNPPGTVPPAVKVEPEVLFIFRQMYDRQISYESLEKASGISFWTLRRWRGGTSPDSQSLKKVLAALGYAIRIVPAKGLASGLASPE